MLSRHGLEERPYQPGRAWDVTVFSWTSSTLPRVAPTPRCYSIQLLCWACRCAAFYRPVGGFPQIRDAESIPAVVSHWEAEAAGKAGGRQKSRLPSETPSAPTPYILHNHRPQKLWLRPRRGMNSNQVALSRFHTRRGTRCCALERHDHHVWESPSIQDNEQPRRQPTTAIRRSRCRARRAKVV